VIAPARLLVAVLVLLASSGPAAWAGERSRGLAASHDASVSAQRPRAQDESGARLRVGGAARWHTLLRFRVGGANAVTRATLRIFALERPARPITVRRHTGGPRWREGVVSFAALPRDSVSAGAWHPPGGACRRACSAGTWLSIDVSRAVRDAGQVSLALLSGSRETLVLAGRRDARHAPRLVVERGRLPSGRPAPVSRPGTTGASGGAPADGVLVAAAGDIACRRDADDPCVQQATSDLVLASGASAVLALGDLAYDDGTLEEYRTLFEPSWGRLGSLLHPVPGNHEYHTAGAAGYFDYFNGVGATNGRAGKRGEGWYSFEVGAWHVVALNSNCDDVDCGPGSPQEVWLRADLAASRAACTLAFWHHPRFSTGEHGDDPRVAPLWQALHDAGAELVVSGHDHDYERFAPRTATGAPDPARGIRQLVAGTGGRHLRPFVATDPASEARDATTFGVLFLTLRPAAYHWRFSPAVGAFTDAGSSDCHG
jgi:hypothetical protein